MKEFGSVTGFEWDGRNREKNRTLHGVAWWEVEDVFFHAPLLVGVLNALPTLEPMRHALGRTRAERPLHIVFTLRGRRIRTVSARPMKRKERHIYAEATRGGAQFTV